MKDAQAAAELSDQLVDGYPKVPGYHVLSAKLYQLIARVLLAREDAATAGDYARKSIDRLTRLQPLYPDMPHSLGASLGRAYLLSAMALRELKRMDDAREAAERAVPYHRAALRSSPESPRYGLYLWDDYRFLSLVRLELCDLDGAARDAEELPQILPKEPLSHTKSADLLVQCAAKAPPEQKARFEDRAIARLREGVALRKLDRKALEQPEFRPLSPRPDFQDLLRSTAPPAAG
jgi:tetratricopeptide (TPR) repeat protein